MATTVTTAQATADLVLQQVKKAANQGTFAVGGLLINNKTGEVIYSQHNKVVGKLQSGDAFPLDPTNHGERQIVSWYYANKARLGLPDTKDLTVVTSLDPCAMCAGCLTTAGFNVAVIAPDDYAGVNWNNQANFANMPPTVQAKLSKQFGYYSVQEGPAFRSIYKGGKGVIFNNQSISQKTYQECLDLFATTANQVRQSISASGLKPQELKDPRTLGINSPVRTGLKKTYSKSLSLKLTEKQEGTQFYKPNKELRLLLQTLKDQTPGAKNAVALIDPFGNLLLASADRFDISPISTAFMNLIQDYSALRFKLADTSSMQKGGFKQSEGYKSLTTPNYCTLVFLHNLDYDTTTTLKDFGIYGSSMEGSVDKGQLIVLSPPNGNGTEAQIKSQIASLPPLYWELVGLQPKLEPTPESIIEVTNPRDDFLRRPHSLRWAIDEANRRPDFNIINIKTTQPIKLHSKLPDVLYPTYFNTDGQTRAWIDGNKFSGLTFKPTAIASAINGVNIYATNGPGARFRASSPTAQNTLFGVNRLGSPAKAGAQAITLEQVTNTGSIQRWSVPGFSRKDDVKPSLSISGTAASLLAVRSDKASTNILFKFTNTTAPETKTTPQSMQPANNSGYGGQLLSRLSPGTWVPQAYLPDGDQLKLTWLSIDSGFGRAEFTTSGLTTANAQRHAAQTFEILFSLGTTGSHSSLQSGSLPLIFSGQAKTSAEVGFYAVSDPITGAIRTPQGKLIQPSDGQYLANTVALAKSKSWWFTNQQLHAMIAGKAASLKGFMPTDNLAVVVSDPSRQLTFSSYPSATATQPARILQTGTADGTAIFNIELGSNQGTPTFDFGELQIKLLGNPFQTPPIM